MVFIGWRMRVRHWQGFVGEGVELRQRGKDRCVSDLVSSGSSS